MSLLRSTTIFIAALCTMICRADRVQIIPVEINDSIVTAVEAQQHTNTPAIDVLTQSPHIEELPIYSSGHMQLVAVTPALKALLKQARPVEPNAVPIPKFALRTDDDQFVLSIGGQINPILGYDIGNDLYQVPTAGIGFVTGDIPVPAPAHNKGDFFINPLNSYVDFTVIGLGGTSNQVTGYLKIGLDGTNHNAFITRAYVTWKHLTIGELSTLMEDGLACQPQTIDTEGPSGEVSATAYQVAYKSPFYGRFQFAIAAEKPTFYATNGIYRGKGYSHEYLNKKVTEEVNQLVPDIPFWVQYQASEQNRIRLAALLRDFRYRDLIDNVTRNMFCWGAMISGNFNFWQPLTFNFQAKYGCGIASYIQDISGRAIGITPDTDHPGQMTPTPMMGLVFGFNLVASQKLQFNAVGSYARVWNVADYATTGDKDGVAGPDNYKFGAYFAVNAFYNITNYLQWGVEYIWGRHQTWNLGYADDSRILTQLSFYF